jgi:predicted transcriptional regulator
MPSKALELSKRRMLYQYILSNPGLHLRALERSLRLGLGDLRHHLDFLEREGLIMTATDGYRKTYFPGKREFSGDKALLGLLRQTKPRAILLILLNLESAGFDYLRKRVRISKSTLSFHMKKLEEAKIVTAEEHGQRKIYKLPDKEKVAELLVTYRPSFIDAAVDRALEAWFR